MHHRPAAPNPAQITRILLDTRTQSRRTRCPLLPLTDLQTATLPLARDPAIVPPPNEESKTPIRKPDASPLYPCPPLPGSEEKPETGLLPPLSNYAWPGPYAIFLANTVFVLLGSLRPKIPQVMPRCRSKFSRGKASPKGSRTMSRKTHHVVPDGGGGRNVKRGGSQPDFGEFRPEAGRHQPWPGDQSQPGLRVGYPQPERQNLPVR
jgi:hypothetical protein